MALFLPAWSVQQALYAASFATALVVVGTHGSILSRPLLGTHHAGLWTTVYLGQFGLLAAAALVMPLNGLLAHWLGASLPLTMLVAPPAIILRLVQLRRRPPPAPLLAPLLLLGLASLALVFSIYSRDISALGLDLHEHIAWVQQIVSGGFVPLAEPGTRIVGDYPRTFHVVTALWDAAGLGLPAGPFTKSMPFLQNALPLLSIAEQLVDAAPAEAEALRRKRQVALALAFFLYAFLLVPMVYPWTDLSGAPRYSGGGVLLLPIVLMLIGRIRNAPQASALALTSAPLVAAWALAWSPIVLILLAVVTGPVLAAFWIFFRPPLSGVARSVRASALVACAALALLSVAQDPWIVGIAARNVGMLRELTHRAGLVTFDEAAASGLATPREKSVHHHPGSSPCHDAPCVLGKVADAARVALPVPWRSAAAALSDASLIVRDPSLPNQKDAFKRAFLPQGAAIADYAGLPFFVWIAAGVLAGIWRSIRRRTSGDDTRLLLASLVGLAAAGIALSFAAALAAGLNDQSHESILVAGYLGSSGAYVSLGFLWLPLAGATLVLAHPLLHTAPEAASPRRRWLVERIGLALWLALPLLGRLNLHRPLQHRGFWTRIGIEDVRALREVEKAVAPDDGVIVPAEHANIGGWEHWVLPLGETAALLPYGERRYLFNVYLGPSYPLSWRDLTDRLCNSDPAVRAAFYRRTRARWVLIRDQSGADAAAVVNQPWPRICGVSFAALGAELPPVAERKGIFLFRLHAPQNGPEPAR